MPTAEQDQWLAKCGIRSTSTAPTTAGRAHPAAAEGPLRTVPVPTVSGDCKEALLKAMRTLDTIAPAEGAAGSYQITVDGQVRPLTEQQVKNLRAKTKSGFAQNIALVRNKALAAQGRYDEQKKVDKEQRVVSTVVKVMKKVTTFGRFEDPGPALTKEVEAAKAGTLAAAKAVAGEQFAKAAAAFADAEAAALKAQMMAEAYVEGMIDGAGMSITALEATRNVAFITVAVLATIATAGAASGAIGATTTAFGAEVGTAAAANAIATAAPIAGSVATAVTKVALGEQIDWNAVALDAALQLFLSRFGGPATKGIAGAVTKRLAGKLAAESLARIGTEKLVQGLILHEGSTALQTVAEATYGALRGKRITWEGFFHTLVERLSDPKGIAVATIVTALTTGAELKYSGAPVSGGLSPPSARPAAKGESEPTTPRTGAPSEPRSEKPAAPAAETPTNPATTRAGSAEPLPGKPGADAAETATAPAAGPSQAEPMDAAPGTPAPADRTMTREQWKAASGKARWKKAVDQAFDNLEETADVLRTTGGKSDPRVDGKRVPDKPPPKRRDIEDVPRNPGESQRDAVARVRTVIGTKISDHPALAKLWNDARSTVLKATALSDTNYTTLYKNAQKAFWRRVRGDAQAQKILADAGLISSGSKGSAATLGGASVARDAESIVSLDHILEKAQGENWKKALDADNLRFEFAAPNTEREIKQMRHPELR